ncbi:sulfur carrier protein ThiS [Paenibacillus durus]|uniref:Thiamine biosynthesis protein ThiS n=1 Tax=Paenibacillus durus ATCC 35681 TaxID=1333534 RepID=A0A0F7F8K1_PAEDU|nr:sulfur carrier protein ThiS [Paenibacillus durus]AKG34093.1 thiamine biosynthesis protein ThiS [Paenibacillus durus ATCC 35681]
MKLYINGNETELDEACATLTDLLSRPEWKERRMIVELNGMIVGRDDFGMVLLADGDRIELVHFVGGG